MYLLIHQYKYTLVKYCQLFDFQTWDFVFIDIWAGQWVHHTTSETLYENVKVVKVGIYIGAHNPIQGPKLREKLIR